MTTVEAANPAESLIGPEDPPPYTIVNAEGKSNVLLVCDHASNRIPRSLDNLGLGETLLQQHIAYDIGSRNLTRHLIEHLDAPAVLAGYSRLVVDLNRSLEDESLMPLVSDGTVILGNQKMSDAHRSQRIREFFTPYRQAIDGMLNGFRDRGITPAIIAIHSFTPQMLGHQRPWQVGVLWDKDPRIPVPLIRNLRSLPGGLQIGDNEPYSGKHPADYTIDHHAEANGLPHVSIEVRQDLVTSESGAEEWAGILHEALRDILADASLYSVWESV
ncbi:MAG TPA: N-formylglutamate amidohydrolase [Gammaproteobacteria bacterium]|nr:N-formylglutamate amidohydrolase [Gammaproteobacteria bacterium]